MPAPAADNFVHSLDARSLGHVLRATVRTLLATTPPNTAAAFTRAARTRLVNTNAKTLPRSLVLFTTRPEDGEAIATESLHDALAHARSLYGAGMGFTSLGVYASIVRLTLGLRWTNDGETADSLALIDGDICQAIQSSKEEVEGGRAGDMTGAQEKVSELRTMLQESMNDVVRWGGEFPFERAAASLDCWKI
ncbi:hypothetical protein EW146_g5039 [Bondarzewia mesenterica]|uniref:Uncharacterized protein n=1 Tax=Bondarzewia mesenterica TaxID=1095465 RepID=A0A4S4LUS4_9AGAM|nr:hypothetical protein EW146_g5039 [Bondarzewia mesenterica]